MQGEFDETQELANIPVGSHEGSIVYLKDVAKIEDSLEERTQQTYNSGKEAL